MKKYVDIRVHIDDLPAIDAKKPKQKGLIQQVLSNCKRNRRSLKVAQRYLRMKGIKASINVLKRRNSERM